MTRDMLCAAILLLQAALIVHSRTGAARYFCWAPFDTQTKYDLAVTVPGRGALSRQAVCSRYHLNPDFYGHDDRSPQHVIDIISRYERSLGRAERAEVVMRYTVNGVHPGEWRWPSR